MLFCLCSVGYGQGSTPVVRDQYLKGTIGKPTFVSQTIGAHCPDYWAKQVWRATSKTTAQWVVETDTNIIYQYFPKVLMGPPGKDGKDGIGIPGPQGPIGLTGPAGRDGVCPNCPPVTPGNTAPNIYHIVSNGVDDQPAVQRAVDSSYVTGRNIITDGKLKFSKGVKVQKDHRYLSIKGMSEWEATNENVWTFLYSDPPQNVAEAESVYAFRKVNIEHIIIKGKNKKQNGIDLHATEGAIYNHIWCYDLNKAIDVCFGLRTEVNMCEVNCCVDGLLIQSGVGRYVDNTNNTTSTSCSNGTVVNNFRAVGCENVSNVGLRILDASLTKVDGAVVEGHQFNIGLDYNNTSSTSTGLNSERIHFECRLPAKVAVIKIRSSTAIHTINRPNFIKPSIYVLTESIGYPFVNIANVENQRVLFDGTNKIFSSGPGTSWKFTQCDLPFSLSNAPKMFTTSLNYGCGVGAGANVYCIESPINR